MLAKLLSPKDYRGRKKLGVALSGPTQARSERLTPAYASPFASLEQILQRRPAGDQPR
jgi:hypothetical protein